MIGGMLLRPRPLLRAGMFGGAVWMGHRSQVRAGQAAAPPQSPAPVDVVSRLRELKGLLDSGALTQEEFDTAKQRLLATT
jgi:putative oligomerization/nucleic acid binding protein